MAIGGSFSFTFPQKITAKNLIFNMHIALRVCVFFYLPLPFQFQDDPVSLSLKDLYQRRREKVNHRNQSTHQAIQE